MATIDLSTAQRKALTEIGRTGRAGTAKDTTLQALIRRELVDTTDPVDLKLTDAGRERVAQLDGTEQPEPAPEPEPVPEETTSIRVSALLRPHVATKLDGALAAKIATASANRDESVRVKATDEELAALQDFAQDVGQTAKDGPTVRSAVALVKWIDRLRG